MTDLLLDAKVTEIAQALERARIPYAFGGAIALAYYAACRGTEDIDINVFLPIAKADRLLAVLARLGVAEATGNNDPPRDQLLLRWEHTPIHVFFSYDPFHESCRARARRVPFADGEISLLSAEDITLFKVIYDRPKDRSEVREVLLCMGERMDVAYSLEWLDRLLGSDDARVIVFGQAVEELLGRSISGA